MTGVERFELPLSTVAAVATGEVGPADVGLFDAVRRSRLLLALVGNSTRQEIAGRGERTSPHARPTSPAQAWALLCRVQRARPDAVDAVLRDPMVGVWALQLLRRLGRGAVAAPADPPLWADRAMLASLAASAAIRAGVRCVVKVPAREGRLWLPTLGLTAKMARGDWAVVGVETGPHGTVVFGDSGSVRLPDDLAAAADGWDPLPLAEVPDELEGKRATVVLDHLSPYRDYRGLTDPVDFPPPLRKRWQRDLAEACELLRVHSPAAHRLVLGTVRSLVPVSAPDPSRPVSVSTPDAPGVVTMSLPNDVPAVAATLVHEASHQLMACVAHLVPLLRSVRDGPEPLFFAPWREDPRPLRGLLYGAQAFAAVTSFWQAYRPAGGMRADFEFAYHRWQLRTALAALHALGGLSPVGAHMVRELARRNTGWWTEPVTGEPARLAELCCRDLTAGWRGAHLGVARGDADALASCWLARRPAPARLPSGRLGVAAALPAAAPSRAAGRLWLARLRCTDPVAFADLYAGLARGNVPADGTTPAGLTAADCALVAGDEAEARSGYRAAAADAGVHAPRTDTWTGLGLVAAGPSGILATRPELVRALYAALLRRTARPPGPEELARWLDASDG